MTTNPAIVFIGFMGAGKSVALDAVRASGLATTETDELLERAFEMPIADVFERMGEHAFRRREAEVVGSLLERAEGGAIALGGGSVLSERVRGALRDHIVVWLRCGPNRAWERVQMSDRPLAQDLDSFKRLHAEREPLYEDLADVTLPPSEDTQLARHALPWIERLKELSGSRRMIWAESAGGSYPIYIGQGLLKSGAWPSEGRRYCVTDTTVGGLYAGALAPLEAKVAVEPGERSKTMVEAERVLRALAKAGMTREDHIVALGGGVVGDLAGFCAHTYQRGVSVVQVPTTLVAQVDSAYGGKTGVDLPEGKNYVGAYHMPKAVIVDVATLGSLPPGELASGFAEALKTGLLAGGRLWEQVRRLESLETADFEGIVSACARYKCEVVSIDERDAGFRAVLNLGHTVGHAIEAASGYVRYRHGEAIALGLLAALRLSGASHLREEVKGILQRHGLPTELDAAVEIDAVLDALQRDKKRTAEGVGFVLLANPGYPLAGQHLDPAKVEAAVKEIYG